MARSTVKDTKVCRNCSALTAADRERCANCGSFNWGPIPPELVCTIKPATTTVVREVTKLAGYRGLPPPAITLSRTQELPTVPKKDPELAAMLSSLTAIVGIWGIGHIYVGKVFKGILLMLAGASTWGLFVGLMFLGKGVLFWFLGVPVWGILMYWAFLKEERGKWRASMVPAIAITGTVFALWRYTEISPVFLTVYVIVWIYLTTRAYNLAVDYNDHWEKKGSSPW